MEEKHQPQWAPIAEEWSVSHGSRVMINYIEQGTIKSKINLVYECIDVTPSKNIHIDVT